GGAFAYGNYPDIDALFQQQAIELGRGRREAVLHKIQGLVNERVIAAPIWQLGAHSCVGPRVGESGFRLIARTPTRQSHWRMTRRDLRAASALGSVAGAPGAARAAGAQGQLTYGIHVSLAPGWFDPAETQGIITPYMVLYALHDSMVKALPGKPQAPCLAESWSASEDGLTHDFVIRKGAKLHNGEP